MFKTILVPTDGSTHAEKAVDLAADLAEKYGARMIILHVLLRNTSAASLKAICQRIKAPGALIEKLTELENRIYDTAVVSYGPIHVIVPADVLTEVGEVILNAAQKSAESRGAANISVSSADDDASSKILSTAEQENADLIVMGSRGLGKLADLLMGGVSHKVSHLSKCTCITVK